MSNSLTSQCISYNIDREMVNFCKVFYFNLVNTLIIIKAPKNWKNEIVSLLNVKISWLLKVKLSIKTSLKSGTDFGKLKLCLWHEFLRKISCRLTRHFHQ